MGDENALKGWKIQIDFSAVNNLSKAPASCPRRSMGEMGCCSAAVGFKEGFKTTQARKNLLTWQQKAFRPLS